MKGDTLFPLNKLKDIFPELYTKAVDKYNGREHVTRQKIPFLDCLWNDVLHFSAVHPLEIKKALIAAGHKADFDFKCYEIDPHSLDKAKTIVYLHKQEFMRDKMNPNNFTQYDHGLVGNYSFLPDLTKDYYREMIKEGKEPLLFHGVVHILFKGQLNVDNLNIISV